MNILKIIFVFFLILLSIFIMICAFIPGKWLINEEIVINKPMSIVTFELSKTQPEYFNDAFRTISASVKLKPLGTSGSGISWKHASENGKFEITKVEKGKVTFEMTFFQPYSSSGRGNYVFTDLGDSCRLILNFTGQTPFFYRISNLFIDQHYRSFFIAHLQSIREHCENQENLPELENRSYMGLAMKGVRKIVPADSLDHYADKIRQDVLRYKQFEGGNLEEPFSALIFSEVNNAPSSDRFYGLISKGSLVSGIPNDTSNMGVTEIYIFNNYVESYLTGGYSGLKRAHRNMQEWFIINDLRYKFPVLESYIKGPFNEADTSAWVTRIVYSF